MVIEFTFLDHLGFSEYITNYLKLSENVYVNVKFT